MECACAISSSVACPALQYFSALSHKGHDFRKEVILHKMCAFTTLFETFFIIRRTERDVIKRNEYWSSCKVPVIFWPSLMKLEFSRQIKKNSEISNFMKIRPVGTELPHADGQTDIHDEGHSRFS